VLDLGAFIGLGAMRLSELVGPTGRVVSVEAHPANQRLFTKNIESNRLDNVMLVSKGVWFEPGEIGLHCDEFQRNSLLAGMVADRGQVTVRTDSVDNIVRDLGLKDVSLASITIDGAEIEALKGMERVLRDYGPCLSIAGQYRRDGVPIHETATRYLQSKGYQAVVGPVGRVYAWKS
jgi:FkbM family methyltransferase